MRRLCSKAWRSIIVLVLMLVSERARALRNTDEQSRLEPSEGSQELLHDDPPPLPPDGPLRGDPRDAALPRSLAVMDLGEIALPSCSQLALSPHVGDKIFVRNDEADGWEAAVVTKEDPLRAQSSDPESTGTSWKFFKVASEPKPGRVWVSPQVHYRLFLSVVAGMFADDSSEENDNDGDFFSNSGWSDSLRCYYAQLLRDASGIVAQGRHPELKDGFVALAAEIEESSITTAGRKHPVNEAVVRQVASLGARLRKLRRGGVALFPCGWNGHAVYCEVQRDPEEKDGPKTFTLGVFNSGDGADYHYSMSPDGMSRKASPALVFSRIPEHELTNPIQLRLLIEASSTQMSGNGYGITSADKNMYEIGLGRLERWLDEPRSKAVMLDPQVGGTCMVTGLHHFVHFKLRERVGNATVSEEVGRTIEQAIQRAALESFTNSVKGLQVDEALPPLPDFHRASNKIPNTLSASALYSSMRRKRLLQTAARQVMMWDEADKSAAKKAGELETWLSADSTPVPTSLQDISGDEDMLQQSITAVDYEHPDVAGDLESVSSRECTLPSQLLPARIESVSGMLETLSRISLEVIDQCFGETYVDWLAARVLSLDLTQISVDARHLLSTAFFHLSDQVRRFSSTQPFADHLVALRTLISRYFELAASHDGSRLDDALPNAPSLESFSLEPSFRAEPLETPQNLLYNQRLRSAGPEPAGEEYMFVPAAPSKETKDSTDGPKFLEKIAMLCTAEIHLADSEKKSHSMKPWERNEDGGLHSSVWRGAPENWKFKSLERYALDFLKHASKRHDFNMRHVNDASPCSLCRKVEDCQADFVKAAACMLSGYTTSEPVSISSDLPIIRKMLVEYHFAEHALVKRDEGYPHDERQPREKNEKDDRKNTIHSIVYSWCKVPVTHGNEETDLRKLQWIVDARHEALTGKRAPRHPARFRLRAPLAEADDRAATQFLFREARPLKWLQRADKLWRPHHDGDNAIVLYNLATHGSDEEMTPLQRTLFEVGMHASLTRQQWLGHLQEHPTCFLDALCRVSTDAILFSDKFSPSTCTDAPETPHSYFEQVLGVLEAHSGALGASEPTQRQLLAMSYARATHFRVQARLGLPPSGASTLHALSVARRGWEKQVGSGAATSQLGGMQRLKYTLACTELLLLVDLFGQQELSEELSKSPEARECAALFMYVTAGQLDILDPAIVHQAQRAHYSLLPGAGEAHMCALLGGSFVARGFPMLQCGDITINMISGTRAGADSAQLGLQHLPSAMREQRFAGALTSMDLKSFAYISEGTLRAETKAGDSYLMTQRMENEGSERYPRWVAKAFVYRQPAGSSTWLQLSESCLWLQEVSRTTVKADVRELLLGEGSDAFCWVDEDHRRVQLTRIMEDGADELVLELGIRGGDGGREDMTVVVHHTTPHLPVSAVGPTWRLRFAPLWLNTDLWSYRSSAERGQVMAKEGLITRFHEGRPSLELEARGGGKAGGRSLVVLPGLEVEGKAVVLEQASKDADYVLTHKQKPYTVLSTKAYTKELQYLLEHGVPHLLLSVSSAKAGGGAKSPHAALVAVPRPDETGAETSGTSDGGKVPVRDAIWLELGPQGSEGMFEPRTRQDRLALALTMMRAKKFDHAFKYMAGVYHLTPWTDSELFLLREIMGVSATQRDPGTSYLRLVAVKFLREECLRFPVAGCNRRLGLDDEEWLKSAQLVLDLAIQTKHLVPMHLTLDSRSLQPTRFFSKADLGRSNNGLRAWLNQGRGQMLGVMPMRGKHPKKPSSNSVKELVTYENKQDITDRGKWFWVYPSAVVDNVAQLQKYYQSLGEQIKSDSTQALLFAWLQPVLPTANVKLRPGSSADSKAQQSHWQLAMLLHIYRMRSESAAWQNDFLRPLAEAWLYQEDLAKQCKNCAVLHSMLQLYLSGSPTDSLEPFDIMIKNLGEGGYDFEERKYLGSGKSPAVCCGGGQNGHRRTKRYLDNVDRWARELPDGRRYKNMEMYDLPYAEEAPFFTLIDSAPKQDLSKCPAAKRGASAASLKKEMLERAYSKLPLRSVIFLALPPLQSTTDRVNLLVSLYAGSRQYAAVFPGVDVDSLHCDVHRFLLRETKEAHEKKKLERSFKLSSFTSKVARALLVFEYKTGFAIRRAQVEQLRDLLTSDQSRPHVQQIMMGGGKTSVYSPVLLQSFPRLGGFMAPASVFAQNAKDLTATTDFIYGQKGFVLSCSRTSQQQEISTLRWVLGELQEAAKQRRYVLMLPKTLQCFQNLLVMNMGIEEKYTAIMQILQVLREQASFVIDEIDSIFDPNTEVNFPLSSEDPGRDFPIMHFLSVLFTLDAYPGEEMGLLQSKYDTVIRPELAEQLVTAIKSNALPFTLLGSNPERMRTIANDVVSCTAKFLTSAFEPGQHQDAGGSDCTLNRNMQILHMFLADILPQVIRFRRNVDYGLSHVHQEQAFVIPYSYANKPVEGSKFSNYLLAMGLSFQYWFLGNLDHAMFARLISHLRKVRVRRGKGMLQMVYEHIEQELPQLPQIPSKQLYEDSTLVNPSILADRALAVACLGYFVVPRVTVSATQVTNYALNMDNSMQRFVGFSGTISSGHIFPSRAHVVEDSSVESRLYDRTVKKPLKGKHIFTVKDDGSRAFVTSLVSGDFARTNALLDCGAFLRDFRNVEVAKLVLKARSDIKVVMHYDDLTNKVVALPRPPLKPLATRDTKLVLSQFKLQYSQIFLYLDQQHTVGTDVRLGESALALLTMSRKTNLEELMQAIMRMRNYQGEQTKGKMQDVLYAFKSATPKTLEKLWAAAKANTELVKAGTKHMVDGRKVNAISRRFFMERQLDPSDGRTREFARLVFQRTHDFLHPATSEDLEGKLDAIKAARPFELTAGEAAEVEGAARDALASARDAGEDTKPGTEEELELEMEQQAELQVMRLRNDENLNEDSFTNNPLQWAPLYALCHQEAVAAAGMAHPQGLSPCAPVSGLLSQDAPPSPVSASLAFALVRPADGPKGYQEEKRLETTLKSRFTSDAEKKDILDRNMQLFADPWTLPLNDEAQAAPLNATGLLVSDYRKNLRSVVLLASKAKRDSFQVLLVTSDEARELVHWCAEPETDFWGLYVSGGGRADDADVCEDPQRKPELFVGKGKKQMVHRLDGYQQLFRYKAQGEDKLKDFLGEFWASHACAVLTPTALGRGSLSQLLPPEARGGSEGKLVRAIVEVLVLAGSEEMLQRPAFKAEFFQRMLDEDFRRTYYTVKQKMGEPLDVAEVAFIVAEKRRCQQQCASGGFDFSHFTPPQGDEDDAPVMCECKATTTTTTTTITTTTTTTATATTTTAPTVRKATGECSSIICSKERSPRFCEQNDVFNRWCSGCPECDNYVAAPPKAGCVEKVCDKQEKYCKEDSTMWKHCGGCEYCKS